jgi:hypothetical protein
MRAFIARGLAMLVAFAPMLSARASQSELVPPTSGVYTAVQFSQLLGDAIKSLASGNKGPTAPANINGAAANGLPWIDDTASVWLKKRYINGGWSTEGAYDSSDSAWVGSIGGGTPASIASAATVDLGSVPQANVIITGTTGVSSFGSSAPAGTVKFISFDNALILTASSNLKIPGGYPLTTAADDRATVRHLGSGIWDVQYTRASGVPIDVSAVSEIRFGSYASAPANHVLGYGQALSRASNPAYLAKVTRAQNGTRTSGNATIASVADTSGMGVGMPVEGTGINAGCTIASLVANTSITLNSSSCVTASGTSTITVFFTGYGSGGDNTTVGVIDCRGRVVAGRGNMGGSDAARLSASYFGAIGTALNSVGGGESLTLLQSHLPTTIGTSSEANIPYDIDGPNLLVNGGGGVQTPFWPATVHKGTINITNSSGGNAHRTVQPTLIAECAVRVIP